MVRKAIRGLALAALLAVGVTARPVPAVSQAPINCADRSEVIEFLARQYREKPAATAQINPHAIMEIYAADNGSWTLIVTDVNGRSCVILAGKNWESLPALPIPKA
ncbi:MULTISPECIES: hypothetical protein [unclassified Ensifer]|uniref:hypothetical protein n=1 Tax=unclassified Ensifer TaxID=2633371 RepID=UPI0008134719|nr:MULTISPECIES: hypothetical protein [unclassified Ensifer]OCO98185.1 hypothetical protein BC362_03655 [Ensifer sp. LC14]OCP03827.1 hypothetical protein BBX50_26640 [Ensifer sp. LC11]OCP04199.1 hypothetical protein BC374_26565 [Ensifer sp. LC13]OCP30357.1 hypothetical protein BC364_26660 [Ensifer sp. LC499]